MVVTNLGTIPWGDNQPWLDQVQRLEVDVNGHRGIAITAGSDESLLGYIYWTIDGAIYQLMYPGVSGLDLLPLAVSVGRLATE